MKIGLIALENILLGDNFVQLWTSEKEVEAYKRLYTCPNLGLLTVAGMFDDTFELEYVDENFEPIDYDKKYDLVCMSPVAQQVNHCYEVAAAFKRKGIPVVVGGIHATVLPEEVAERVDHVIIGEFEGVWEIFAKDLRAGCLKKIYRQPEGQVVDLTKTPPPRYDLLKTPKNYKVVSVQVTRGCPHDCEFCASAKLYGRQYRHKTVDQIVREIQIIKEIWGNVYIYFTDDNMLVLRDFSKALLTAIIPLRIRWYCFSDVSISEDDELLELLAQSGCTQITFGFESLSKENLAGVSEWKRNRVDQYPQIIKKVQSYGIGAFGSFVVGLDHDTTDVFQQIKNFVIDNHLFGTSFSILTPFPGTRLYQKLREENRILDFNWDHYTCFEVVYQPKNMTCEELREGFKKLYQDVYSEQVTVKRLRHFTNLLAERRRNTNKNRA